MKYFTQLFDLPIMDLSNELSVLLKSNRIEWGDTPQICINSVPGYEHNYKHGIGSLDYKRIHTIDENGNATIKIEEIVNPIQEFEFTELCDVFKDTLFEEVYNALTKKFVLGRVRIMKSSPSTCLSWHVDRTARIHYPVQTQDGCFMVINDEVQHMPEYTWWLTNTTYPHTAFNGSNKERIHLVGVLLETQ